MPPALPAAAITPHIAHSIMLFSISLSQYLAQSGKYDHLAVGALILAPATSAIPARILLIKRAASDAFPNIWEIPGGCVDLEDETVLHGLVREVWEETGLRTKGITGLVLPGDEETKVYEWVQPSKMTVQNWGKLCFLVEVEDGDVVLDPEEHQDWGWFRIEEVNGLDLCFEDARQVIRNAFTRLEMAAES